MLKMMALDEEDLTVLAAHCQDAVFKSSDIHFSAADSRLIIALNRFVWEEPGKRQGLIGRKTHERRNAVLHINDVQHLSTKGIKAESEDVLSLLAITFEPDESGVSGDLLITLSAGAALRAKVNAIEVRLSDLGGAWETRNRPRHPA